MNMMRRKTTHKHSIDLGSRKIDEEKYRFKMMRPNAELAANDATTPLKQTNVGLLSPSQWQDVGNDAYGCI